jgi:hypothetical protein
MVMRWISTGALALLAASCDRSPSAPAPAQGSAPPAQGVPSAAAGAPGRPARLIAVDPPAAAGAASPNLVAAGGAVLATWLEPTNAARKVHRLRFARLSTRA